METREKAFEGMMDTLRDKVLAITKVFQERARYLEGEIILLKLAMVHEIASALNLPPTKVQVPEPKPFGGA